jgi:AraC-like DNA-binding protein
MDYKVYTPVPELQPFVKCLWTLEGPGANLPERQRIIPDGCMEMIFHYGDPYRQYLGDGSFTLQPKSFIYGQITDFLEIEPTGASGIIAARFHPEGLIPFLNRSVSSLENRAVDLEELFGKEGKETEQKVMAATDTKTRIELIQSFLLSRLADPQTIDSITKACVEVIFQTQGQLDIITVANKIKISRRNMERKFLSAVGISPKQLSKLVRLQTALKMLEQDKFSTLTSLAHENGYYDQAHFIRDFREFTGMSPKSFFNGSLKISALFIAAE